MNNLSKTIEYYNNISDDMHYTVETLAWKLLTNDENINKLENAIKTLSDCADTENDEFSFSFEIYITLFCELIFNLMKINFNYDENNNNSEFTPKYSNYDLNDIISILKIKFAKLCLLLCVHSENIDENMSEEDVKMHIDSEYSDRYCRILLVNNKFDRKMLAKYISNKEEDKFYMFIINNMFKTVKIIKKIYSVMVVNNKIYKIYFDFAKI